MSFARLAVPVAALLFLAGCAPSASTAANVAGTLISESTLTETVDGCAALGVDQSRQTMLNVLVVGEVAKQAARQMGVQIDQAAIDEAAAADPQIKALMANPGCARAVETNVVVSLLVPKVDQPELMDNIAAIDVQVNPRYGVWDPATAAVGGSGSVSIPAGS